MPMRYRPTFYFSNMIGPHEGVVCKYKEHYFKNPGFKFRSSSSTLNQNFFFQNLMLEIIPVIVIIFCIDMYLLNIYQYKSQHKLQEVQKFNKLPIYYFLVEQMFKKFFYIKQNMTLLVEFGNESNVGSGVAMRERDESMVSLSF